MYDNYDEDPYEKDIFDVEEDALWNTGNDDVFGAVKDEDEEVQKVEVDEPLETEEGEDLGALGLHIDEEEKEEEL